jgi:hypothetical protein
MPQLDPAREGYIYRLAILASDPGHVLGRWHDAELILPRVSIPRWVRPAAEIQKAVRDRWNLNIVILDFLYRSRGLPGCVVAQLLSTKDIEDWISVAFDQLSSAELTESERVTIQAISKRDAGDRGAFSRNGWIDEATAWVRQEVGSEVQLTGEVEQHNASGTFALVRFDTKNEPAYWLKATGEPNRHELGITAALAASCPDCLPPLVATRHDWNAWLMEEAGEPLEPEAKGSVLRDVVLSMARLQTSTASNTEQLLAAGATDQRMPVLRRCIGEIVAYLEHAMDQQVSTRVPRLAPLRLHKIGRILKDAWRVMEELGIPDTVIHNDMNRGNILVRRDVCVFTDWSEACVGPPCLTLQRLLMLLPGSDRDTEAERYRLKQAYSRYWLDCLPSWKLDIAFALMPLLAPASYLYGRGDWLRSKDRFNPELQGYARSIARQMDRAARSASLLETLCN